MIKLPPSEEKDLGDILELSQKSLVSFRFYLLTNAKDEVKAPAYHSEWSKILLQEKNNFAVEAYREAGKGQIVLRSFPLHCLMYPTTERDYIVLVKQNATLAAQKLLEIETEYLTNPFLSANLVKVQQKSASIFSVDVKDALGAVHNVRIEAYGKGSSIRGLSNVDRRPKICHAKGSLIWQDGRLVKVEDSKWQKIELESNTVEIRVHGIPYKEKVSLEHLFWCRTKKKINNKWRFINIGEWKKAEDISVNDYIGTPIDYTLQPIPKIFRLIPTITKRNKLGQVVERGLGKKEDVFPECFNDNEFWWAVGLWWGDGHISKNKVHWTCANKYPKIKTRLANMILKYSDGHYKQKGRGCEVLGWNRTDISDWLKTWRYGNAIKIPPVWVRHLDNDKIKHIVKGYLDSDGWIDKKNKQARITSVNYEGLLILSDMIARLGIASYIRKGAGPRLEKFPGGHISQCRQKYDLMISNGGEIFGIEGKRIKPKKIDTIFISDSFIWRKVKDINEDGIDMIIPIQTKTHTYLSPLGLSHNCILDDPQDTEDARSDTVLDADWKWFLGDVMFLGQKTRIFLIGNNLGEKCIIERVFNAAQELGFQTRKIAILNEQGESNWPEKFPLAEIDKQRESFRRVGQIDVWMRERMCEATTAENRVFDKNDFIRYSYLYVDKIIKGHNLFITVDPASSINKSACYRAICVNAVSEQNLWTIVDFPYGRWKSDEFIDKLFETVIKWTPYLGGARRIPVGIEKGHFKQILEPFIYKEMQRRNVYFEIVPIEHASVGSKLERVKALATRFKAKSVQLPSESPWLAELETELMGVTIDGFKSLFVDLIDALAMQQQIARAPMTGRQNRFGEIDEVPSSAYSPLNGTYSKEYAER